jgi:hypothetical protein
MPTSTSSRWIHPGEWLAESPRRRLLRRLCCCGCHPFLWSTGGGDYCRTVAGRTVWPTSSNILPKPDIIIDDMPGLCLSPIVFNLPSSRRGRDDGRDQEFHSQLDLAWSAANRQVGTRCLNVEQPEPTDHSFSQSQVSFHGHRQPGKAARAFSSGARIRSGLLSYKTPRRLKMRPIWK